MILSDAEVAVAAAEAGAAVVRRYYGEPVEHHAKSHRDFATTADLEAEQAILEVIRAHRPDDGFLGEESGHSGPDGERQWLVDPLCGTLNFAVSTPLVAVNVALRMAAGVTAAASADPLAGELFWTDGTGAWLRRNGLDSAVRPSADSLLVDLNLDPPFPNSALFRATTLLADPEFIDGFGPRVLSTTLAVAWVAAGRRAGVRDRRAARRQRALRRRAGALPGRGRRGDRDTRAAAAHRHRRASGGRRRCDPRHPAAAGPQAGLEESRAAATPGGSDGGGSYVARSAEWPEGVMMRVRIMAAEDL